MAGQPGRIQASFSAGELEDLLEARRDLKKYASGLKQAVNLLPLPQGPATLRPGMRRLSRVRPMMAAADMSGIVASAPAGGDPAAALDGNYDTVMTSGSITGEATLLAVTFPEARPIAALDVSGFACPAGGTLYVRYWADGGWQDFNDARTLRPGERSRRFCAPPQSPVWASEWRILVWLPAADVVTLRSVTFWSEGASYGNQRLRSFAYDADADYELVIGAGHGDVFKVGGGWITGFWLPHTSDEIRYTRWAQQLNTGLLFSPFRPPMRIFRESADMEWQVDAAPLANVPRHDFGDVDYSNGTTAVWDFQFVNVDASVRYTVTVDGEETDAIVSNTTDQAPNLLAALEKLPSINAGLTATGPVVGTVRVYFTGTGNEGNIRVTAARVINKSDAAIAWINITKGEDGGEDIYSAARGWPRAGVFYQQRLLLGGSPALANAFVASVTGEYYNLNTGISSANGAFIAPMDTRGAETIEEMTVNRALLIFTSRGEYWVTNAALTKAQPPNPVRASTFGIRTGVPVVENEGATIFASRSGNVLGEFAFNEVDQVFASTRLSLMASHLVSGVRDLTIRRTTGNIDANVVYYCNDDGTARMVSILREQEVTGFSRIDTDGQVLALCCGENDVVAALTQRAAGDATVRYLERFEDGLLLDQAVTLALDPPAATITGLAGDFEGAEVWAIADGQVYGPFIVAAGAFTLPVAAASVTVGRWRPFLAEILPPPREVGPRIVVESPVGYHTVRLSLVDTASVAVQVPGFDVIDQPLLRFGDPSDVPSTLVRFTGTIAQDGLQGSADNPTIIVTQVRPGALTLRSIVAEGDM